MKNTETTIEKKFKGRLEKEVQEEVREILDGTEKLVPGRKGMLRKGLIEFIKQKRKGEKMRTGKIATLFVLLFVGTIVFSSNSYAYYEETNAFGKLTRGVVNIATSPVEIFRNIYNESQYENIGYGMTVGLGKGIVQTVMRIGAGAVEIVTFPFNFPDEYKDPIVEPEYVWEEWGY